MWCFSMEHSMLFLGERITSLISIFVHHITIVPIWRLKSKQFIEAFNNN